MKVPFTNFSLFVMGKVFSTDWKSVLTSLILLKISKTFCVDVNGTVCSVGQEFPTEYEKPIYNVSFTPFGHRPWPSNCPKCKLNFDQQYCVVNSSKERQCLIRRAYLETDESCFAKRGGRRVDGTVAETLECAYVEVCIFETENDFEFCENTCALEEFDKIKCESKKGKSFVTRCHHAFIHCPAEKCVFQDLNATNNLYRPIFSETGECGTTYDKLLDRNKTWYWLNQILNERIHGFTALNTVNRRHKIWDKGENEKIQAKEVPAEKIPVDPWKIVLPTILVFGAVVALGICLKRLKNERSSWRLRFTDSWVREWERATRISVNSNRFEDTAEIPSPFAMSEMESVT